MESGVMEAHFLSRERSTLDFETNPLMRTLSTHPFPKTKVKINSLILNSGYCIIFAHIAPGKGREVLYIKKKIFLGKRITGFLVAAHRQLYEHYAYK